MDVPGSSDLVFTTINRWRRCFAMREKNQYAPWKLPFLRAIGVRVDWGGNFIVIQRCGLFGGQRPWDLSPVFFYFHGLDLKYTDWSGDKGFSMNEYLLEQPMADVKIQDQRFGDIAVHMNLVAQDKLDRALVVQKMIFARTKVQMPIGKVLKEMSAITQEQIDTVLDAQRYLTSDQNKDGQCEVPEKASHVEGTVRGLCLNLSKDKLVATLSPSEDSPEGFTLAAVKRYLADRKVIFGLVDDDALMKYLQQNPLPEEPFTVARGIPPVPAQPPKIVYHFDTDPLRIGTLNADGYMDWKNRGDIPQAAVGDLLVEKIIGKPGTPGTSVSGGELTPPRIRDPQIKCGKGAERSEDGLRVMAKIAGTPKLGSDGKIAVFGMLPINGDIGVETGHIHFDGYIEASGGVTSGYSVKGKGFRTSGIQDAVIEIEEDLNCTGGIYGSTLKVGGNIKAGHIHNCTVAVLGDIVVKKEIYGSTVETTGRCMIGEGKIVSSSIDAKKGVYARTIGSDASSPCTLTVGIDRKYHRDKAIYEEETGRVAASKKGCWSIRPGNFRTAGIHHGSAGGPGSGAG